MGITLPPLIPFGTECFAKLKRWHRRDWDHPFENIRVLGPAMGMSTTSKHSAPYRGQVHALYRGGQTSRTNYLRSFLNSHNLMVTTITIRHLTRRKVKKKIIFKMMLKNPWKSVLMMWSSNFVLLKVVLKSKFKFWIQSKSWCQLRGGPTC